MDKAVVEHTNRDDPAVKHLAFLEKNLFLKENLSYLSL